MRSSTNYNLRLVEGSDLVNPLIQDVPNYEKIDEVMKDNEMASIGEAVELVSATVHAITRTWNTTSMFKFTATANYTAGETFTVDGIQVTALLPSGEPLASNCYITGSEVLCHLNSATNLMTVFVSGGTVTLAQNSEQLGGQLPAYYATKTEVETAQSTATASGVLAQSAQSAVTELENKVNNLHQDYTLLLQTSLDGTFNVQNLNNYKFILVIIYSGTEYYGQTMTPVKLFKEVNNVPNHAVRLWSLNTSLGGISYVSDTSIQVQAGANRSIIVYGIS